MRGFLARFMAGRNGFDALAIVSFALAVALGILKAVLRWRLFHWLAYLCLLYGFFRILSHDIDKRRMENARFTEWISSLGAGKRTWREDRESRKKFRFFSCPNCRARVRVPKGKGKIIITCPMCRKEFIKKT